MRLSLIVNVLESYEVVQRQLLHLERILPPACELIIVDDGSVPSLATTVNGVPTSFPCRLYCTGDARPWTQPRARNLGASAAQSDTLVFFDIDHILTPSVLEHCLRFEGDKMHWLRRPAILDENGFICTAPGALAEFGLIDWTPSVHQNSFLIRKQLFDLLGGYDERFCGRYGGDDVDFNERYAQLCRRGLARPEDTRGEGFVFPDPARDVKGLFHALKR